MKGTCYLTAHRYIRQQFKAGVSNWNQRQNWCRQNASTNANILELYCASPSAGTLRRVQYYLYLCFCFSFVFWGKTNRWCKSYLEWDICLYASLQGITWLMNQGVVVLSFTEERWSHQWYKPSDPNTSTLKLHCITNLNLLPSNPVQPWKFYCKWLPGFWSTSEESQFQIKIVLGAWVIE